MNYNPKVVSFDRSSAYVHHRAMVNRRENNPIDALELMRHAVERSPDNREYRLDLAELYCEMGCYEQSNSLLLDMLADENAPSECFYGLALNQLSMNDLEGAKLSLQMYRQRDPEGVHAQDVRQLASELDIVDAINRPASRRLSRAMRIADSACSALQEGDLKRSIRLFERSLSLSSEQFEMRAMYAMALMMNGDDDAALLQAQRASEGFPPSARAMCVAAQVLSALDQTEHAKALLLKVMSDRPTGVELRLLIFSLGELQMHEEISECVRLALQETPYDRQLLHIRATALYHLGAPAAQIERFWQRILRIDPEDSVAGYYQQACARGELSANPPGYAYQVPEEECNRRTIWLSKQFEGGLTAATERWATDEVFRRTVLWAAQSEDEKLCRAAVTVIAAMDDERAHSSIRSIMFSGRYQPEIKSQAAFLLQLKGIDMRNVFPANASIEGNVLPKPEELMGGLPVGERQLIRYSNGVLENEYGVSALSELALMWTVYRHGRGSKLEPLINTETASAALACNYLLHSGKHVSSDRLAEQFGCSKRRLVYYARHIADILERSEGDTEDEDL